MLDEPQGVELMEDIAPARWIQELLRPWGNSCGAHEQVQVGSLLPEGFAAYARVFHPASLHPGNERVRWSTVASWTGRTVHPLMQFARIANLPDPYRHSPWGSLPTHGNLSSEECRTIANVLREFTLTPGCCYFCVWDGYGFLDPARYKRAPRVRVPHRAYLLFRGPLDAVTSFTDTLGWWQSPNIWWPEDRAWCVATEIDLFETYVGGSNACIQSILSCPDLEALPASIEARVDFGGDTINI